MTLVSDWRRLLWRRMPVILAFTLSGLATVQSPLGIQNLVSAGYLEGMRWPNFRDCQPSIEEFYKSMAYTPAWVQKGQASPAALFMVKLFKDAWKKGLEPEDYDASRWDARISALQGSADKTAGFDVALTICTMRYVSALRLGRINPKHLNFDLDVEHKRYDLAQFVRDQLLPASDISAVLEGIEPPFAGYRRSEQALARYLDLARTYNGEKLPIPAKPVNPGQTYAGVPGLSRILQLVGDLPPNAVVPGDAQVYDGALVEAVKRFQHRHGLEADGRLGSETVKKLNVPFSDRVRQLQLALERWRWLPVKFSEPPILVNIPDFRLRAFDENNNVVMEMRVVVGKAVRTLTPVFTRDMTYVVLRPYWNVPPSILRAEIVPAIQRNRSYIANKNYEVTTQDGKLVTSGEVSDDVLTQLRVGKLSVRQKPGPANALGLVKLMFPNEYNVYLHSTPAPQLFLRSRRDFSHGCIRVEKPAELATWALRNNSGWTLSRVRQAMQNGDDNVTVRLARSVPIFIIYGTAIAYANDEVHFYDDIYGHDAKLAAALAKGYPYP